MLRGDEVPPAAAVLVTLVLSVCVLVLAALPLTAAVQRIALEAAETLGVDPDTFGLDLPGHQAWGRIQL